MSKDLITKQQEKEILDQLVIDGFNHEKIKKALYFMIQNHDGQFRASGDPYYTHPIAVAKILVEFNFDEDSIITALLHDVVEDTNIKIDDIRHLFGKKISQLVDGVTKLNKISFKDINSKYAKKAENFRKFFIAISHDIRVLIVKLADRLHNIRTLHFIKNKEKQHRIATETIEIYAPLAERIGMHTIKTELQEICFEILHPKIFNELNSRFNEYLKYKDLIIENTIETLKTLIRDNNIEAEIEGRKKTLYSTWMKMKYKKISLDQMSDIIAFRVIVSSLEDCYKALGVIHREYKSIPGNFCDFISTPKDNGYRSIHSLVIGPYSNRIELQIRTSEMHKIAQTGIAAHWAYKEQMNEEKYASSQELMQYNWIQELLLILSQDNDPKEFLRNTKLAIDYNQVFCFTPDGHLIALPKGATVIDFAYAIHSEVGNFCSYAKINGVKTYLSKEVHNGDQIEIITSDERTTSPLWEKFAVTGKARGEISKAIKLNKEQQYTAVGKRILNIIFKQHNISKKYQEKIINDLTKYFNKDIIDELYFSVGRGIIDRGEILEYLIDKKIIIKLMNNNVKINNLDKAFPINISDLNNEIAIKFCKLCYPVPGDEIVGLMNKNIGITIHKEECSVLNNNISRNNLFYMVWNEDFSKIPCVAKIEVFIANEPYSLAKMSTVIADYGVNINDISISRKQKDQFCCILEISLESISDLSEIIDHLYLSKNVISVRKI